MYPWWLHRLEDDQLCSKRIMIGFRKLDALGEECSQRVLIGGIILGSELKEDEASSSKGLCPAMAKDSFRC
ncbi:hypothetical protein Tco_1527023 [Tanacetum coccineum]